MLLYPIKFKGEENGYSALLKCQMKKRIRRANIRIAPIDFEVSSDIIFVLTVLGDFFLTSQFRVSDYNIKSCGRYENMNEYVNGFFRWLLENTEHSLPVTLLAAEVESHLKVIDIKMRRENVSTFHQSLSLFLFKMLKLVSLALEFDLSVLELNAE